MKLWRRRPEAFWDKLDKSSGPDGCWRWTGTYVRGGYGVFGLARGKSGDEFLVHRIAWTLTNSEIPAGLLVLHKCDNRACGNPTHLFLGTHKDNVQDMMAKGRGRHGGAEHRPRGIAHPWAKLDDAKVIEIRQLHASGRSKRSLGVEYGVDTRTIDKLVRRKSWAHVS